MPQTVLNISQNYFVRGGSDRYFFVLSELLERHGHRVIPFSSQQPQRSHALVAILSAGRQLRQAWSERLARTLIRGRRGRPSPN